MVITITACLLTLSVYKVQSYNEKFNITTLYPVNKTNIYEETSEEVIHITDGPLTTDASKELNEITYDKNVSRDKPLRGESEGFTKLKTKSEILTWKINATLTPPTLKNDKNTETSILRGQTDESKQFKPSQQLGSFYDEDTFVIPTVRSFSSFRPVKPSAFISSSDFFKLEYKIPKERPEDVPYKFQSFPTPSKFELGYDSKPTVEMPVKIPAGGLYKFSDPFKDKPSSASGHDDFGLEFSGGKEVKKRKNPWHGLLNLVTALLPIGIIVSALTPSVVTLHNADNNNLGNTYSRRSDGSFPTISERCKRRLLCEIHSERNYMRQSNARMKHCYKLQCENPDALSKVLSWLLTYHSNTQQQ